MDEEKLFPVWASSELQTFHKRIPILSKCSEYALTGVFQGNYQFVTPDSKPKFLPVDKSSAETVDMGHGRIEERRLTAYEDRSKVRCGNIPQVMAALYNTVIGLMRWLGHKNIAAARPYFAFQPWYALEAITIQRKTE